MERLLYDPKHIHYLPSKTQILHEILVVLYPDSLPMTAA
jgi:hypothetical protein